MWTEQGYSGLATSQRVTIINLSGEPLTLSYLVLNKDLNFKYEDDTEVCGKASIQGVSNRMQRDETSNIQLKENAGKVLREAATRRALARGSLGARMTVWPPHCRGGLTLCLCPWATVQLSTGWP